MTETPMRVCAACDVQTPDVIRDPHPAEWMCGNDDCGIWFHVGGDGRCPRCGSEGLR